MTATVKDTSGRVARVAHLRWVAIADMHTNPQSQRRLQPSRITSMMDSGFDPEMLGNPIVSLRDGRFYIIDGQHRIALMRRVGWGDQQIQCWVYTDLDEAEEAEMFLRLNDVLRVNEYSKFTVGLTAGREEERQIDQIVRLQDLRVTRERVPGGISAITALRRVYTRADGATLGRTLRIIRDAFGDHGFDGVVIDGVALMCERYNGDLSQETAITRLSRVHGGVTGILTNADAMRLRYGKPRAQCVAAACVDAINRGAARTQKLKPWFAQESNGSKQTQKTTKKETQS